MFFPRTIQGRTVRTKSLAIVLLLSTLGTVPGSGQQSTASNIFREISELQRAVLPAQDKIKKGLIKAT